MARGIMDDIARYYRSTHEHILKVVDHLDDRQIRWTPIKTAPSIGFHLWHIARWTEYLQEMISDGNVQIWDSEGLAGQWGLGGRNLGFAETGMGMDDAVSASLPLPEKAVLLDYVRRALAKADRVVSAMKEEDLHRIVRDRHASEWNEGEIGDAIMSWLVHDNRHLGMIEPMLGAQGLPGTATR